MRVEIYAQCVCTPYPQGARYTSATFTTRRGEPVEFLVFANFTLQRFYTRKIKQKERVMDDQEPPLTCEEVKKIRRIIKREDFSEEAHQKLIDGAISTSKFIIEAGKVMATIAVAIAFLKGWAIDFVVSALGSKK